MSRNAEFQIRFPGFQFAIDKAKYKPCWVRTYPSDMEMSEHDHLAVASGAWSRYEEWGLWAFWKGPDGRWCEDLSGVSFEDVDVAYLDYVGAKEAGYVSTRVKDYMAGVGKPRFRDEVVRHADNEVGWMYATMGTFLAYQDRNNHAALTTDSAFWEVGNTPQDNWSLPHEWGTEDPNYRAKYVGPWATLSRAMEAIEDVYHRALELGPDLVPEGEVAGPYAYVCEVITRTIESLPATGGDEAKERVFQEIRGRADDILDELKWLRLDDPSQTEYPPIEPDLVGVLGILMRRPIVDDGPSDLAGQYEEDEVEVFRVSADCALCMVVE